MQRGSIDEDGRRWVLLAVARDDQTAHEWSEGLAEAGIEAEVRIEDAAHLIGRSSSIPGANPAPDLLFAFPLYVPASQRDAAAAALIDLGWDGRHGRRESGGQGIALPIGGALLALLAGAAVAIVLVLRGS